MSSKELLLSVDLEDVRDFVPNGERYRPAVPELTKQYLDFFSQRGLRATFFIVGRVAEREGDLIRQIADQGHEIACHSYRHRPLTTLSESEFTDDLSCSLELLRKLSGQNLKGFRAPTFSLTEAVSKWSYKVLAQHGIEYSSSVLPAKNPLYGWPHFGEEPRFIDGILEVPMSLARLPFLKVPLGGVYFRLLPAFLIQFLASRMRPKKALLTYFHPYDIDVDQEKFMHPELNDSRFLNALMYYGRGTVFSKLDKLLQSGWQGRPYGDYAASLMKS